MKFSSKEIFPPPHFFSFYFFPSFLVRIKLLWEPWLSDKETNINSLFFSLSEPNVFDECGIEDPIKNKLLEEIRKKLAPKPLKIRADIEVSCFSYEGIEAVKKALIAGKKCSTEELVIKVIF